MRSVYDAALTCRHAFVFGVSTLAIRSLAVAQQTSLAVASAAPAHAAQVAPAQKLPVFSRANQAMPSWLRVRGQFRERVEGFGGAGFVEDRRDLYLADRLILMTDGPEATVGDVLQVPFPRPRTRAAVLAHPEYHASRRRVIDFLEYPAHQSRPSALDGVLHKRGAGGEPSRASAS